MFELPWTAPMNTIPGRRSFFASAGILALLMAPGSSLARDMISKAGSVNNSSPAGLHSLKSSAVLVQDIKSGRQIYAREAGISRPIASISKLLTALVVLESGSALHEVIQVTNEDVDRVKFSRSYISVGAKLSRFDLLCMALMSSENRAAHALGRNHPGGMSAFVSAMNAKAISLGMLSSRFVEPTGLSSENISTPKDLFTLLKASYQNSIIRSLSSTASKEIGIFGRPTLFHNTNPLVRNGGWKILVSKTGYIGESGRCLAMVAKINQRDVAIILLGATGKEARTNDAIKIRQSLMATSSAIPG